MSLLKFWPKVHSPKEVRSNSLKLYWFWNLCFSFLEQAFAEPLPGNDENFENEMLSKTRNKCKQHQGLWPKMILYEQKRCFISRAFVWLLETDSFPIMLIMSQVKECLHSMKEPSVRQVLTLGFMLDISFQWSSQGNDLDLRKGICWIGDLFLWKSFTGWQF